MKNPSEIIAAGADAVALHMGVRVRHPHPLARGLKLRMIAEACGRRAFPHQTDPRAAASMGLTTSDFGQALADGVAQLVVTRFDAAATHLRFCSVVGVKNFRPAAVPAADVETQLLPVGAGGEIHSAVAVLIGGATTVTLVSYARALLVTRETVINDDVGFIESMVSSVGPSASRLESSLVVGALESPPDLDDGQPVFGVANTVASALDATALGTAMTALRTQPLGGGGVADLELRHLVVAPGLELAATKLIFESGLAARVQVTSLNGLPAGRWYALGDPQAAPSIAVLRLRDRSDEKVTPVRVEPVPKPIEWDGLALRASAELGAAVVSRIGIIRGGV